MATIEYRTINFEHTICFCPAAYWGFGGGGVERRNQSHDSTFLSLRVSHHRYTFTRSRTPDTDTHRCVQKWKSKYDCDSSWADLHALKAWGGYGDDQHPNSFLTLLGSFSKYSPRVSTASGTIINNIYQRHKSRGLPSWGKRFQK